MVTNAPVLQKVAAGWQAQWAAHWRAPRAWLQGIARGLALFLGGFTLLNIAGDWLVPGFDANLWWIDLRMFPAWAGRAFLALGALLLLAYGIMPRMDERRRGASKLFTILLLILCLYNAGQFYLLLSLGTIRSGMHFPFSLGMACALAVLLGALHDVNPPSGRATRRLLVLVLLGCLFVFPLVQMYCFGKTDYRRASDAIVVFGAGVYADGTPSLALSDRVLTAINLYQQGYAPLLIFSGGPGEGLVSEPEAMRRMAIDAGVPERAIILDQWGLDTHATVRHTAMIFRTLAVHRALAVSQFYHLPRIKMAYQRAGLEVYTVPALETRRMVKLPLLMLREIPALWAYYLSR